MPGFPRQSRLLAPDEFKRAFSQRPAVRGRFFTVHRSARQVAASGHPMESVKQPRLGIVIPKKLLKTAVHRNLVKRLTRENFRAIASHLPPEDFVVRLSSKLDPRTAILNRREITRELATLFTRLTGAGMRP